jgi:hypothetical protein
MKLVKVDIYLDPDVEPIEMHINPYAIKYVVDCDHGFSSIHYVRGKVHFVKMSSDEFKRLIE